MSGAVELDISDIVGDFPNFRVALVVAIDLSIPSGYTPELDSFVRRVTREVSADLVDADLAAIPEIRVWRDAYKAFGVKKTSYRSSIERLLKNLQRGAGLPRVNALVDVYNAVSVLHRMPIGADDLDKVRGTLAFRRSRPGDSFVALGDPAMALDPPKPQEIVYADAEKCLCRRWNWYQDARSAVSEMTRRAVLTVQTLTGDNAALEKAASDLAGAISSLTSGQVSWAIADAHRRSAVVPVARAPDLDFPRTIRSGNDPAR